jgi:uncharacterized protein YxjI
MESVMLIRENMMGMRYSLHKENENQTRIVHNKKFIVVNMKLEDISQCWYNWQMRGEKVQKAFQTLSGAEREFLMTGITENEWNEIFKEPEE